MKVEPILTQYLSSKASELNIPLSGTFELSPCCNFNCKMCYVRKSREEVDSEGGEIEADTWIKFGRECREAGMLYLLITGGEPFLYKDFKKVYLELKKMGFVISINSNGTLIDENMVQFLKTNPPSRINITIYGGNKDTYKKVCGEEDGFYKAINAVKMLKESGISVKINSSIVPYNAKDLEEIYNIGKKLNVFVQATSYMFPPVRKSENFIGKGNRMTPEEAGSTLFKIDKLRFDRDIFKKRVKAFKQGFEAGDNEIDNNCEKDRTENIGCRAGKSAFWINWKGELTPCGLMNEPRCNVLKEGFDSSWKKIIEETKKMYMPLKCTNCKMRFACEVCGAVVLSETGDLRKEPDYLCRMTKEKLRLYDLEYRKIMNEEGESNEDKEGIH